MNKAFNPQPGSLVFKVIQFLTTNPDEVLDAEAISAKFDSPMAHVHTMLGPAVKAGVLVRKENLESGELEYLLGKPTADVEAAPGRHPVIRHGKASALPTTPRAKPLDLGAIVFQSDVPAPTSNNSAARQWPSVFERMSSGDSFAVPVAYRAGLAKAMTDFHKAKKGQLTMRKTGEAEVRVWRLA